MPNIRTQWPSHSHAGSTWPTAAGPATPSVRPDAVDEVGVESFPCSDAPSWTLGRSTVSPDSVVETERPLPGKVALKEVAIGEWDAIPAGEVRAVAVEGREIAICKVEEQVYALSGSCSYHPVPLRGAALDGDVLTCQWYGAQFDVRTGESVFLRSVQPLSTYATAVRDGQVYVQLPVGPAQLPSSRWIAAEQTALS